MLELSELSFSFVSLQGTLSLGKDIWPGSAVVLCWFWICDSEISAAHSEVLRASLANKGRSL